MNTSIKRKCFTIMPFTVRDPDLPRYYNDSNHWNEVYSGLIAPAVKEAGFVCERDDDSTSRPLTENIWRKIEDADVILCDLSAHNPNVYLELGWALRADKRFVLIKDDITAFNFYLNQFYTYTYSHRLQPSALRQSTNELAAVLKSTLADDKRQYSMFKNLTIQLQAVETASKENVEVALLKVKEFISEVCSSAGLDGQRQQPWAQQELFFPDITTQAQLGKMLPGTTWRKRNNVEHIVFEDGNVFYNNHAGHPNWRKNKYQLGDSLGEMTLVWGVDGLVSQCQFNQQLNEFVEVANSTDYRWSIIATEPHTPSWGI